MGPADYAAFAEEMNLSIAIHPYTEYDEPYFTPECEEAKLIEHARHKYPDENPLSSLRKQFDLNEHEADVDWINLEAFARGLKVYKEENKKLDWTDFLEKGWKNAKFPTFKIVLIDEAQDLSKLQWKVVEKISNGVDYLYIAGDDDQAIYRWAGADIEYFRNLKGEFEFLKQSFRVPRKPFQIAMQIAGRIHDRYEKEWNPRDEEGEVYYYPSIESVDMDEGKWLILGRTKYLLEECKKICRDKGLFYQYFEYPSVKASLCHAIIDWEQWKKGKKKLSYLKIKEIYACMSVQKKNNPQGKIKWGCKKLDGMTTEHLYTIKECIKNFGLLTTEPWHDAFDLIGEDQVRYIRLLLFNGETLTNPPRIKISTIHGAKGSEQDNVVVLLGLTKITEESYYKLPDDTHRVFYVAITRTKKNLHLIDSSTTQEYAI